MGTRVALERFLFWTDVTPIMWTYLGLSKQQKANLAAQQRVEVVKFSSSYAVKGDE